MRIHTDTLLTGDIYDAAKIARVTLDRTTMHNSRSRDHAFDITLQGESRRHQNGGDGMAATWDQWGVFLSILFMRDPNVTIPRAYADDDDFHFKTFDRFNSAIEADVWPHDAHGDHKFDYAGVPYNQQCRKCTARYRWQ